MVRPFLRSSLPGALHEQHLTHMRPLQGPPALYVPQVLDKQILVCVGPLANAFAFVTLRAIVLDVSIHFGAHAFCRVARACPCQVLILQSTESGDVTGGMISSGHLKAACDAVGVHALVLYAFYMFISASPKASLRFANFVAYRAPTTSTIGPTLARFAHLKDAIVAHGRAAWYELHRRITRRVRHRSNVHRLRIRDARLALLRHHEVCTAARSAPARSIKLALEIQRASRTLLPLARHWRGMGYGHCNEYNTTNIMHGHKATALYPTAVLEQANKNCAFGGARNLACRH